MVETEYIEKSDRRLAVAHARTLSLDSLIFLLLSCSAPHAAFSVASGTDRDRTGGKIDFNQSQLVLK